MRSDAVSTRSAKPSIAELRAAGQPPEVLARRNAEHWAGRLYMRRLSVYATWVLVRAGVSANGVTAGMALVGLGGAWVLSGPGLSWAVTGALLIQLYLLLDCSDGEIARWTGTSGATGIYLDRIGHYLVEAALLAAVGLRAGGWSDPRWTVAGLVAALLAVLGKAETDVVEVARAKAGLPASTDDAAAPRAAGVARLRRLAGRLPVYRFTGAVEASFLVLAAAVIDELRGDLVATRALVYGLIGAGVYVVVGHLAMILASNRLRP